MLAGGFDAAGDRVQPEQAGQPDDGFGGDGVDRVAAFGFQAAAVDLQRIDPQHLQAVEGREAAAAAIEGDPAAEGTQRADLLAGLREPAQWDVLGFAHGPLQQAYRQPALLLGLRRPAEAVATLWPRLRRVLAGQHMLLELPATLPAPLSLLEHQVQIGALVLEALRVVDWDLLRWPGQEQDLLLYGLRDPAELSASVQLPALANSDEGEP